MSSQSTFLSLPYIQNNQAQKHVTHNEALRVLDNLLHLGIVNQTETTPPAAPTVGTRYIVGAGAEGDWAGQDLNVAVWDQNAWAFYTPQLGWTAFDADAGYLVTWTGQAWVQQSGITDLDMVEKIGVQTAADDTNRLAVASDATLFTHSATGGDHQLKINRASDTDTASLLFQSNWTGQAEMGLAGSNDFAIKTSADGSTFQTSLLADAQTGSVSFPSGVTGLTPPDFGTGPLVTTDYVKTTPANMFTNGLLHLGHGYNYPSTFSFDATRSPTLSGSVAWTGHYDGLERSDEFIPVDPNLAYKLRCYMMQASVPGDWSSYTHADRHEQLVGFACYDADGIQILSYHHMWYKQDGIDSRTTLTAPLSPGDTVIQVANAAGWNTSKTSSSSRGVIIFDYKDSQGQRHSHYSRLRQTGLFDLTGVDAATNTITLNQPLPTTLANPDDPSGTWPVGTPIANCTSGTNHKYALVYYDRILEASDVWIQAENHMGGLDQSGGNVMNNFAPGTVSVKFVWLPNYSNRSGGYKSYPDTGNSQNIYFSGLSMAHDGLAHTSRNTDGHIDILVPVTDPVSQSITLAPAQETRKLL